MNFKQGDKVKIVWPDSGWDGSLCVVEDVFPGASFPYRLRVLKVKGTGPIHKGATGGFSDRYLTEAPKKKKKPEYSIAYTGAAEFDSLTFELLKRSSFEYWAYTATRYSGLGTNAMEYHLTDSEDFPVGMVVLEFDPENGMQWLYTDGPAGTVEGTAKTLEEAFLKLTKSAFR